MKKILRTYKFDIVIIGILLTLVLGWHFLYEVDKNNAPEAIAAEFINTGNPFYGWAWNDNIGWLSFNCENTDSCGSFDYSVGAEDLGDLTARLAGCAWSELAGWLCFDTPDVPPDTPATSTMLDLIDNELSGWARFCNLADDPDTCSGSNGAGWVKMRCDSECGVSNFGVYMTKDQSLHGQAFSNDYGWISFNCEEAGPSGQDWCATSSYHVAMKTNVTGWAYNSKADWISLNCNNENECGSSTYGVHLDHGTQTFAGYAWSDNVGWISFQESNPPNTADISTFCDISCNPADGCTACLNADNNIYGWAKILSYGDDGWIKFTHTGVNPYTLSVNAGAIEGWAWSGSDVIGGDGVPDVGIGWVAFGSAAHGLPLPPEDEPYIDEYFNYNLAPTTANPTVFEYSSYQGRTVFERRLYWTFTDPNAGDTQRAYRLIIDDSLGVGGQPPDVPDFDSGVCLNQGDNGGRCVSDGNLEYFWINQINNSLLWDDYTLDYGDTFYWWIMVWDQSNEPSTNWNVGQSFTIDPYEWPDPYFYWHPSTFSQGEDVAFISTTSARCYRNSYSQQVPCDNTHTWAWLTDETSTISENNSYNASSTVINFSNQTTGQIHLQLTDTSLSISCSTSSINIGANVRLPSWIETQ